LTRLKVGDGPDSRVPPVSVRRKKKRRGGSAGPAGLWSWAAGPLRAQGKRKRKRPAGLDWMRAERIEEREREKKGFSFFSFKFFFSNSFFQTFKLQSNKNPCIQIMMHKHLLFLNYFGDV
jgi:hypothetical protein